MQDRIALFDLDGSMADFDGAMVRDLNKVADPSDRVITRENLRDFTEREPWKSRANLIKNQPDWWYNLEVIESGIEVFRLASSIGFKNHILTNGPRKRPNAWAEKVRWVLDRIGDIDVHITANKGMVYGRVLFDDYPQYCNLWLNHRPRGYVIMPAASDNQTFNHPRVHKYNGIQDLVKIEAMLVAIYHRKDGQEISYDPYSESWK